MKVVLVTGGFDPLHSGHIEYFKAAKALGDELHVGINSDEWLIRKKGRAFLSYTERKTIVENLSMVDKIIQFNDDKDVSTSGDDELQINWQDKSSAFNGAQNANTLGIG